MNIPRIAAGLKISFTGLPCVGPRWPADPAPSGWSSRWGAGACGGVAWISAWGLRLVPHHAGMRYRPRASRLRADGKGRGAPDVRPEGVSSSTVSTKPDAPRGRYPMSAPKRGVLTRFRHAPDGRAGATTPVPECPGDFTPDLLFSSARHPPSFLCSRVDYLRRDAVADPSRLETRADERYPLDHPCQPSRSSAERPFPAVRWEQYGGGLQRGGLARA